MKNCLLVYMCFIVNVCYAQTITDKLAQSVQEMEADATMRHAMVGMVVVDSKTGQLVFEHNAQVGLAPASTQKLFTSCAAFDLLGKDYRYVTNFNYYHLKNDLAIGYLRISPSGDPSFGSARFATTNPAAILGKVINAVRKNKMVPFSYVVKVDSIFDDRIPGGWMWEDIGNYYGAGAFGFNWMENQYDLVLKSGSHKGDTVVVAAVKPPELKIDLNGNLHAAEKGSGDNTIVYLPYGDSPTSISGTIPVDETAFEVSAAITKPWRAFSNQLIKTLQDAHIDANWSYNRYGHPVNDSGIFVTPFFKHVSPPLDSLNYWFLKKSINLYGEAFLKTMAFQQSGMGTTEKGVALLKDFWAAHGIEKSAINICDGSGLSPQNRVTADALVKVLQYAKTRPWFDSFYYALPTYNGMKMKSGSIGGARAYAGYHTAANGKEYCFAIIVNNYDGSGTAAVKKMYRVLDSLK